MALEISKVREGDGSWIQALELRRGGHSWRAHERVVHLQVELNEWQGLVSMVRRPWKEARASAVSAPDVRGLWGWMRTSLQKRGRGGQRICGCREGEVYREELCWWVSGGGALLSWGQEQGNGDSDCLSNKGLDSCEARSVKHIPIVREAGSVFPCVVVQHTVSEQCLFQPIGKNCYPAFIF